MKKILLLIAVISIPAALYSMSPAAFTAEFRKAEGTVTESKSLSETSFGKLASSNTIKTALHISLAGCPDTVQDSFLRELSRLELEGYDLAARLYITGDIYIILARVKKNRVRELYLITSEHGGEIYFAKGKIRLMEILD